MKSLLVKHEVDAFSIHSGVFKDGNKFNASVDSSKIQFRSQTEKKLISRSNDVPENPLKSNTFAVSSDAFWLSSRSLKR